MVDNSANLLGRGNKRLKKAAHLNLTLSTNYTTGEKISTMQYSLRTGHVNVKLCKDLEARVNLEGVLDFFFSRERGLGNK